MKRGELIPAVAALIAAGRLHRFDGDWIKGIAPSRQLAAARKCLRGGLMGGGFGGANVDAVRTRGERVKLRPLDWRRA